MLGPGVERPFTASPLGDRRPRNADQAVRFGFGHALASSRAAPFEQTGSRILSASYGPP
jgi:hypothetical protein